MKTKITLFYLLICFFSSGGSFTYGQVVANEDDFSVFEFTTYIGNALENDSFNQNPISLTEVEIAILSPMDDGITLDSTTGDVENTGFAPAGFYSITYSLTEIANPTNTSIAVIFIEITAITWNNPGFPVSYDDDFSSTPIDGFLGGTTASVKDNDSWEMSDIPIGEHISSLSTSNILTGLILNQDGTITVSPGTTGGTYFFSYTATWSDSNFNIIGNSTAQVTVVVSSPSVVVANYDDFATIPLLAGTTTFSILANDTLDLLPATSSNVSITGLNTPAGFTINSDGTISIGNGVFPGTYFVPYQICSTTASSQCSVNYAYLRVVKSLITGNIKFDADNNGCDGSDSLINFITLKNNVGTTNYQSWSFGGSYELLGDFGNNTVAINNLPSYFTATPAYQTLNIATPATTPNIDFCINANAAVDDLAVSFIPLTVVRPGIASKYEVVVRNIGSTTISCETTLAFDNSKMSFTTALPLPNATTANTVAFGFSNLQPFESRTVATVYFQNFIPPLVDIGEILTFTTTASCPGLNDIDFTDNVSVFIPTVVNSYDPNDVTVHEGATIAPEQATDDLHYTIRFQNTGNASAINIYVAQELDPLLDWSSLQLINTSHNCRIEQTNGSIKFYFDHIYLDDSTSNEPGSHGYLTYKISPNPSFSIGDTISSTAGIYFDYNAPVITNTATTTIVNITPKFTQIAPICDGETLTALSTTSENGITGAWSPSLDNTTTTTYTFTPDAGQFADVTTMTITVNSLVTPAFTQVDPICNGETLTALPTTSENGITGTWSPALDNTTTATYTFTPDAGQCATIITMIITVNNLGSPECSSVCWEKFALGGGHTLAIKTDGTLWAWGNNAYGQLGDGTFVYKNAPTKIGSDNNWQFINAGVRSSHAIKTDGTLWAWGQNSQGELGDGTIIDKNTPVQIGTDTDWQFISSGINHTLAIKNNGTLWAWGNNTFGQLGDNTTTNKTVPTQIGTDTNWASCDATNNQFSIARKSNGLLYNWGYGGFGSQLGNGGNNDVLVPTMINTANYTSSFAGGFGQTLALRAFSGIIDVWGWNFYGQLGNGTNIDSNTPAELNFDTDWTAVDAGYYFSIAKKANGTIWASGRNDFGQLGNGNNTDTNTLSQMNSDTDWDKIYTGLNHVIATKTDGTFWTWGWNQDGQLGNGTNTSSNIPIPLSCSTTLSTEPIVALNNLKIYPNPAKSNLTILSDVAIQSTEIIDINGRVILKSNSNSNQVILNVDAFADGVYLIKINTQDGSVVKKFIKN